MMPETPLKHSSLNWQQMSKQRRNPNQRLWVHFFGSSHRCCTELGQDERKANLDQLTSAKGELALLEKELLQYGACDPVKVEEKKRGVMLAKEAAIRWTGMHIVLLVCSQTLIAWRLSRQLRYTVVSFLTAERSRS